MEKELYRYNPWWERDFTLLKGLFPRKADNDKVLAHLNNRQVVFLTGLRRVGKTSLMRMCIEHLIEKREIPAEYVLYVSLDDYLLKDVSIIQIVEAFRKMHRLDNKRFVYLFLDEITFKIDYELQLKNLYDLGHCKIFVSSSSASLLKNRNAHLTGRSITLEILPLDYPEYLIFKNLEVLPSDAHLHDSFFKDYLITGGIPEYVISGDDAYIRELMDNIIHKDIAAIHGIRQLQQLKDFFLMLMERSGKTMSINKIAKVLGISNDTSKRFFDLFCDTYIVHPVSRFGKLNEQMVSPKKIYCCDTGIRTLYTGERDWGALFENYCYLRLKHLNLRYIYQDTTELDFFTENKWLLECKFHQEVLNEKQQALFDRFPANERFILRTQQDVANLLASNNSSYLPLP
jgi:predicted AAA+ superfamily ATPase